MANAIFLGALALCVVTLVVSGFHAYWQKPQMMAEAEEVGRFAGLAAVNPNREFVIQSISLKDATTSMTSPLIVTLRYDKKEGCTGSYIHRAYTTDRDSFTMQPYGDVEADPWGVDQSVVMVVLPQIDQRSPLLPGQYWYGLKVRLNCPNKSEQVILANERIPFTVAP